MIPCWMNLAAGYSERIGGNGEIWIVLYLGFDLLFFALQYDEFGYIWVIETEMIRLSVIENGKY